MKPSPTESTVRIGPILELPGLLDEFGVHPHEVLAAAGIDPRVFRNPDNLIPFESRLRLLNVCARRTRCSHFGLLLGQRTTLHSFGLIGFMALNSPDVGSALNGLIRFLHLHVQGSAVTLEIGDEMAFMGYGVYQASSESVTQLVEAGVAASFNALREWCGSEWQPVEVCFSHRKPSVWSPFQKIFNAPVRFDAEKNGIYFPAHWLKQRVRIADPELLRLLRIQIDELERSHGDDFLEQVRRMVHVSIPAQNCSAGQVARLFSIHSRTLHRYLRAYGTSFREIKDQCSFDIARQMLENSDTDLYDIAVLLGYSDRRAFSRAFRKWSGTTPTRWRAAHR